MEEPTISSAEYPKMRSAAAFQVSTVPSSVLLTIASSEDSTIEANLAAVRSATETGRGGRGSELDRRAPSSRVRGSQNVGRGVQRSKRRCDLHHTNGCRKGQPSVRAQFGIQLGRKPLVGSQRRRGGIAATYGVECSADHSNTQGAASGRHSRRGIPGVRERIVDFYRVVVGR